MTLHDVLKFAGHVAANVTISEIPLVKVHMRSIYYNPDNICGRRDKNVTKRPPKMQTTDEKAYRTALHSQ